MWALNGHEYKGVITRNSRPEYSNLNFEVQLVKFIIIFGERNWLQQIVNAYNVIDSVYHKSYDLDATLGFTTTNNMIEYFCLLLRGT